MKAYIKYNYFHMEQRLRFKPDPFKAENFYYNEKHNYLSASWDKRCRGQESGM